MNYCISDNDSTRHFPRKRKCYPVGTAISCMGPTEQKRSGYEGMRDDMTIIVAAFNRPRKLAHLLHSIATHLPGINVVIADNSVSGLGSYESFRALMDNDWPDNWSIVTAPVGNLSAARNAALAEVPTPHFCLIDDDHWFQEGSTLLSMYRAFQSRPKCHILGGSYQEPGGEISEWYGFLHWDNKRVLRFRQPLPKTSTELIKVDMVHNFFIGDTAMVRRMGGWDSDISIVSEHPDFFLRAKLAGLNVMHDPRAWIGHIPGPDPGEGAEVYEKNRRRYVFRAIFLKKWKISRFFHNSGRSFVVRGREAMRVKGGGTENSTSVGVMTTARSGSSCIGQVLEILGVCMGETLLRPTGSMKRVNPDGYFEDASLMRIARQLGLADSPPRRRIIESLYDQIDEFFHHLACRKKLWGFKNPTLAEHLEEMDDMLARRSITRKWIWADRPEADCVRSFMEAGWGSGSRTFAERSILPRRKRIAEFYEKQSPEHALRVDFYELLDDPCGQVNRIAKFVGVSCPEKIAAATASIKPSAARSRRS